MEATTKRKYTFRDRRWQWWIIFQNNKPVGLAFGTNENQTIMNFLIHRYPEKSRNEIEVQLNEKLESFDAKPVGRGKGLAIEKFFKCLTPKKPKTAKTYKFSIVPDKSWQLKIPDLPPVDTTLDALN